MCRFLVVLSAVACLARAAGAQIVVSGNENKIALIGGQKAIPGAAPDSLSVIDFSVDPPKVTHLEGISNSVVGPPSNIAVTPDGKFALVADSIKLDAAAPAGWVPAAQLHIVDLTAKPPAVVANIGAGLQPSGISIAPDGRRALVANRADGTVSVVRMAGAASKVIDAVKVCEPAEGASDVAVSPDGTQALVSIQKGGHLVELKLDPDRVSATGRKVSVYGQPYRVVISPDGEFAFTAGAGYGNALDMDALSIIELKGAGPVPRTVGYLPLGSIPESLEVSPDGRLIAAVAIDGSNLAPGNPLRSNAGSLVIVERRGRSFAVVQRLPTGLIPEGVAFTGDGRRILVQCHPDKYIQVFNVGPDGRVSDSGERIVMPGMPSSLRAAPFPGLAPRRGPAEP